MHCPLLINLLCQLITCSCNGFTDQLKYSTSWEGTIRERSEIIGGASWGDLCGKKFSRPPRNVVILFDALLGTQNLLNASPFLRPNCPFFQCSPPHALRWVTFFSAPPHTQSTNSFQYPPPLRIPNLFCAPPFSPHAISDRSLNVDLRFLS